MSEDDTVWIHGGEIPGGVNQGFSLDGAAAGIGNIKGVRAHALCGNLKRKPGSGAGFKEKIDNGFTAEGRNFFYGARGNFFKRFCSLQNGLDIFRRKIGKPKEMFMTESILGIHTILSVKM